MVLDYSTIFQPKRIRLGNPNGSRSAHVQNTGLVVNNRICPMQEVGPKHCLYIYIYVYIYIYT